MHETLPELRRRAWLQRRNRRGGCGARRRGERECRSGYERSEVRPPRHPPNQRSFDPWNRAQSRFAQLRSGSTSSVKASLVGLLAFAVARPDLPQFHGKAMVGRALTYPIAALIVPAAWWFLSRTRRREYPYALDVLLVLPFLIDVVGNATNLWQGDRHGHQG
jgi:hypothetical protein